MPWGRMRLNAVMRSTMSVAVLLGAVAALAGCAAPPQSSQPDVDAVVLATNDRFGAVSTIEDGDTCRTTITLDEPPPRVSAHDLDEAVRVLADAAASASCRGVLVVVTGDGEPVEVSHIPQYLDVEFEDGALIL